MVGLSGSSSEPIAAVSVDVKHEFDEFRHVGTVEAVVMKLESTSSRGREVKEEGGAALGVHEDRVFVKDEIRSSGDGGEGESKATIRADVAAGEVFFQLNGSWGSILFLFFCNDLTRSRH